MADLPAREPVLEKIVSVRGLTKRFGGSTVLRGVSFDIAPGSIIGLIGPNGAGKTTTLRAILGLTDFKGEISVFGMDPRRGRHKIMERVCFIADVGVLPRWLRVSQTIDYIAAIHPGFSREKAETMLAKTNISPQQKVRQLSKGMVTQLHLVLVMAINADLLVLDEPTLGLDILYRKTFYDRLLNDYFNHQTSIIISTHQVEEIESLLTHLLFINRGEIVLNCGMNDLDKVYSEVLVTPEKIQQANALGPIHSRDVPGHRAMIFEHVAKEKLIPLGDIRVPGVADLFVARMQ